MTTQLSPGMRLRSTACDTEVIVVRAPVEPVALACGGAPMVAIGAEPDRRSLAADQAEGTAIGKRYTRESADLELLCTRAGQGSLTVAGVRLPVKDAKALPSSD